MGLPAASLAAAEEGRDLAEALGYGFMSRHCRIWLGVAAGFLDDISGGLALLNAVVDDTQGAGEHMLTLIAIIIRSQYEVAMGDVEKANETLKSAFARSASMGGVHEDSVHAARACIAVMAGNAVESRDACEAAVRTAASQRVPFVKCNLPMSEALVNLGDLVAARRWIDEVVSYAPNAYQMYAFMVRAVVAFAQGETDQSEVDAHTALTISTRTKSQFRVGLAFDCLGLVSAADESNHERATRLLAAAAGIRARTSEPRYVLVQECGVAVDNLRKALGEAEFDAAWAEGMALSTEEAIAYAQRGRGERKRPTSGWNSLTPTEADVVKLVAEGLGNKDIAERLFISPRTVQTHLTHVYAKLGLTSRIQLIQEAGRHV
jgi:ATP/maltotriose-dependent transcriptional regulator MalT